MLSNLLICEDEKNNHPQSSSVMKMTVAIHHLSSAPKLKMTLPNLSKELNKLGLCQQDSGDIKTRNFILTFNPNNDANIFIK